MWWHCRCTGVRLMYTSVISIAVAFVLALVAPAHAGAPTDALKGHVDQVVKILSDPSLRDRPEVRRAKVRKRSEEHTSELQSRFDLVCRLLLEKKNTKTIKRHLT